MLRKRVPDPLVLGGNLTVGGNLAVTGTTSATGAIAATGGVRIPTSTYVNLDGTGNNDNGIGWTGTVLNLRAGGNSPMQYNPGSGLATLANGYKLVMAGAGDSTASPGNATSNTTSGKSAIAAGASAATITNSHVTASSIIMVTPLDTDATLVRYRAVPAAGSFTVTGNANATAAWKFSWFVLN